MIMKVETVNPIEVPCKTCGVGTNEMCTYLGYRSGEPRDSFHAPRVKTSEAIERIREGLERDERGEYIVPVDAFWNKNYWSLRIKECPYCGSHHYHGGGTDFDEEVILNYVGDRVGHCSVSADYTIKVVRIVRR